MIAFLLISHIQTIYDLREGDAISGFIREIAPPLSIFKTTAAGASKLHTYFVPLKLDKSAQF